MAIIKIGNPAIDLDAAEIPNLSANKITSDTLSDARLPANALNSNIDLTNLSASNLTSGTVADARLPANALNSNVSVPNQSAFKNIIINGDMSIAQRATSVTGVTTSDGYYACDRWYSQTDTGTWTISQSTDVPTGQGFFNSFKMDCTSAGSSNADEVMIRSKHEGQNLQYLKYGTANAESLTLSFWIKSNKIGNYYLAMANANTTQDRVVSFGYTIDSADTWEKKTITIPGDTSQNFDNTNGENLTLYWLFSAASGFTSGGVSNTWTNYAANRFANSDLAGLGGSTSDYVNITGVQLEAGTTASDFEFLPVDVNTTRCLRYFQKTNYDFLGFGFATATSQWLYHNVFYNTLMRATPTASSNSNAVSGTSNTFGLSPKTMVCNVYVQSSGSNSDIYIAGAGAILTFNSEL